jgi:hypothetical protein
VLLPLPQQILHLKEFLEHEAQQVPAPLKLIHRQQALLQVLILVLLPSGAVPHDLTQPLLFQK